MSLSDDLGSMLEKSGESINSIADVSGVSQSVLQRFYQRQTDLSLENASKLAEALGLVLNRTPQCVHCPFCGAGATAPAYYLHCVHVLFTSRWIGRGAPSEEVDNEMWMCRELEDAYNDSDDDGDAILEYLADAEHDSAPLPDTVIGRREEHKIWFDHVFGLFAAAKGTKKKQIASLSNRKRCAHEAAMEEYRRKVVQAIQKLVSEGYERR